MAAKPELVRSFAVVMLLAIVALIVWSAASGPAGAEAASVRACRLLYASAMTEADSASADAYRLSRGRGQALSGTCGDLRRGDRL